MRLAAYYLCRNDYICAHRDVGDDKALLKVVGRDDRADVEAHLRCVEYIRAAQLVTYTKLRRASRSRPHRRKQHGSEGDPLPTVHRFAFGDGSSVGVDVGVGSVICVTVGCGISIFGIALQMHCVMTGALRPLPFLNGIFHRPSAKVGLVVSPL